ncbi:hypothetical protein X275_11070 [Marinitoga sp. 1197]|uniref:hypothetical protein n=1 Tax=Marinitoga sp. 1197 TaxID=1428449 RepID=UPI0006416AEC|nr:hypothetical protein [Marinitoga sp. 1197]KLO20835.1 hypothetical protein X275_11070 [Marinitoga sp. 1197]
MVKKLYRKYPITYLKNNYIYMLFPGIMLVDIYLSDPIRQFKINFINKENYVTYFQIVYLFILVLVNISKKTVKLSKFNFIFFYIGIAFPITFFQLINITNFRDFEVFVILILSVALFLVSNIRTIYSILKIYYYFSFFIYLGALVIIKNPLHARAVTLNFGPNYTYPLALVLILIAIEFYPKDIKEIFFIITIYTVVGISRVQIIYLFILFFLFMIYFLKNKKQYKFYYIFILIIVIYIFMYYFGYFNYFNLRFTHKFTTDLRFEELIGNVIHNTHLWGTGLGGYFKSFNITDAHSLALNLLFSGSIIPFVSYIIFIIIFIEKLFRNKAFFSLIIFILLFLYWNIAGGTPVQYTYYPNTLHLIALYGLFLLRGLTPEN